MKDKLIEILADYKNVPASEIKTDAPFTELGLDSLDVAELVMQIEDELGVTLEMSVQYNTIDKLVAYIEENA
ncbi:MAG: acyl carrier protein [Clostridia bacterium]|nr:acyl carrier protein [Clostridia bacterium]